MLLRTKFMHRIPKYMKETCLYSQTNNNKGLKAFIILYFNVYTTHSTHTVQNMRFDLVKPHKHQNWLLWNVIHLLLFLCAATVDAVAMASGPYIFTISHSADGLYCRRS